MMTNLLPIGTDATPQSPTFIVSEAFDALTKARMWFEFHLDGVDPAEKEAREQEAVALSAPPRADYTEKLEAAVVAAADQWRRNGSLSALEALPDLARLLDAELDEHLFEFGIGGFHDMELENGRRIRTPAYIEEALAALRRRALQ